MPKYTPRWRAVLWSLVFSVIVAEVTSAIGLKLIHRPLYWTADEMPRRTEKDPWGAWGVPNSKSRLVGPCYNVEYNFNSVGARDKERHIQSPKRWIVLGDSFVDGFGIEENQRFTNILEERTGWEFANFGNSGDFGPLQYYLIYKDLAKQFEHDGVIVGLLLFNDFTDNDAEWWKLHQNRYQQNRYRPYAILSEDNRSYKIIYGTSGNATPRADFNVPPPPDDDASALDEKRLSTIRALARRLSEVSATFSLFRQLSSEFSSRSIIESFYNRLTPGYFTTDQREITAVKLILHDLAGEIGNRPKIMLLFPVHSDFVARRSQKKNYSDQVNQFIGDLHSDGWRVIDMADALSEADQSTDLTLGCNAHWNATTNRRIADFLLANYRKDLTELPARSK